jgi:hypothetical protein
MASLMHVLLHAASAAEKALEATESTMTVGEIATHRIFVALLHSRHLRQHPALRQQWLEALDGLGGFVDLIPGRGQGASRSEPGRWLRVTGQDLSMQLASLTAQRLQALAKLLNLCASMHCILWCCSCRTLNIPMIRVTCSMLPFAVPAGFAVSLHCPTVGIKLTSSQQPQTAQLVAELRGLQLSMPAAGSAAVTVQHLQVLLNSAQPSSTASHSSGCSNYVPVLQLPKLDDLRANLTHDASSTSSSATASTTGGSGAQAAASGLSAAAQSPRPSALGRIYQDSLISAYISKMQVRGQHGALPT